MICKKCSNTGVYNEVNFKGFYYCRTCKIEIELEEVVKQYYLNSEIIFDIFDDKPFILPEGFFISSAMQDKYSAVKQYIESWHKEYLEKQGCLTPRD